MDVNTPLAKTRDGMRSHEGLDIRRDDLQQFAEQRSIDQDIAVADFDLQRAGGKSFDIV